MASGSSEPMIHMLISVGATAPVDVPEARLAQALADCGRNLPGSAAAAVAYFTAQRENLAPLAHHSFIVNLAWRIDRNPIPWDTAAPMAERAIVEALALNGAEVDRVDVASTVLWRHLVAVAEGLALSARIPPGMFPAVDPFHGPERPQTT